MKLWFLKTTKWNTQIYVLFCIKYETTNRGTQCTKEFSSNHENWQSTNKCTLIFCCKIPILCQYLANLHKFCWSCLTGLMNLVNIFSESMNCLNIENYRSVWHQIHHDVMLAIISLMTFTTIVYSIYNYIFESLCIF